MDKTNYISNLYSFAQKNNLKLEFEEVEAVGPDNIKTFTLRAVLDGKAYANGVGKNKKEAKQIAAKNALEVVDPAPESREVQPTGITKYVSWLYDYVQKNNLPINVVESTKLEETNAPRCCKFIVGDKEYPAAYGTHKKETKEEAAKLVYCEMFGCEASQTAGQDVHPASGGTGDVDELRSKTSILNVSNQDSTSASKTDFVSKINQYCLEKKCTNNCIEVTPGAQSQKRFAYRMEIDQQLYPVGTGMNKREAKQMAAQLAWAALQKQLDWDSKDDESERTSTSAASSLLEPEFSDQSAQSSSGSSWIQFENTLSSPVQDNSSAPRQLEENTENALTKRTSRFASEYDGDVEPLGNGAYGCVYKAKKLELDRYCAIKEIQTKDTEKSLQEVKVLWDLHHPNIVRYYTSWFEDSGFRCPEVWPDAKFLFIEMELCDGGTLRRWIRAKNKEPLNSSRQKESLEFAGQILSGVEYIHRKKLIHRDLKPENILFGHDGKVRIGDFGLATQDNDEGEAVERTENRGTISYMAPEQFGTNYDRKVDIFALALIFFELFWRISTGHERVSIWRDVRSQNLPKEFIGTYPIESRSIKTMLSKNPEDRPEASAIKSELEKWTRTSEEDIDQKTV